MGSAFRDIIAFLRSGYGEGGWIMQPLLVCFCFTLALMAERMRFFWRARRKAQPLLDALELRLREGDVASAIAMSARAEGAMARIALATLGESMRASERMCAAAEAQLIVETPPLYRFGHLLAMLRQLGTLLGLLGTITELSSGYSSGHGVSSADATSRAVILALRLSEALNCTALGLFVSTFAMVVAWMTLSRAESIETELRLFTVGLENMLITYRTRLRWNDARCEVEPTSYR